MDNRIYGLIGRTLKHSYSVPIHKMLGNEKYRLFELEPDEVEAFIKQQNLGGINVTIPYKKDALKCCDVLSPLAREIGCVNTVVRKADGVIHGYNTDAYGLGYMAEYAGISFEGKKVLILGSGGSSLTAQAVAKNNGAKSVTVISRSGEDNYTNLEKHKDAQIIVNTTPVGMYPNVQVAPINLRDFPMCEGVLDLIYNPMKTALLLQAEELGIRHIDGLVMLVAQAKKADEFFFGREVDDSEIHRIVTALRREKYNIVLIGMPGCGKNTVGEELQKLTKRELIDLDAEIIKVAGKPIPEIFADGGEDTFRRIEAEVAHSAGMQSGKIIVTGGGIVTREENRASLRQNGIVFHIERDIDSLARDGRPLSQNADLREMYNTRIALYEYFRDKVVYNNTTVQNTAQKILSLFNGEEE